MPITARLRLSATGLALALVGYLCALTPSLSPRTTLVQVAVTAVLMVTGYALGCLLGSLGRAVGRLVRSSASPAEQELSAQPGRPLAPATGSQYGGSRRGLVFVVVVVGGLVALTPLAMHWQDDQSKAAGWAVPTWWVVAVVGPLLAGTLVLAARVVRSACNALSLLFTPNRPTGRPHRLIAASVVVALAGAAVYAGWTNAAGNFAELDASMADQRPAPTSPLRSGGPGSLLAYDELGHQGRDFVADGPDASTITGFTGRPALDPIRVFVGLHQGDGPQGRAEMAVAELTRTGAFERERLVIVVTSGLGAVHPVAATVLEYVADGDVATVTTQFSDLPSWMTLVTDSGGATVEAGALVGAVQAAMADLPESSRPKLYLYGESLGAYGAQQILAGQTPEQVTSAFDGALFVGSPSASPLRRDWPDGGISWEPTVGDGAIVRFAASPERVPLQDPTWGDRRVLFMQLPSDPVAALSTDLLTARPAWLVGERGELVSPKMIWAPLVTYEQLLLDLTTNGIVPPGIGHNYAHAHAAAWAAVMNAPGWTLAECDRLNVYRKKVAPPPPHDP